MSTYSENISQERRQKERRRLRGIRNFWGQYRKSKFGLTGLALFLLFLFAALLAPWISPYDPNPQGQFDKVHPSFAEPQIMGVFNPDANQAFNFATVAGKFEYDSISSIDELNNTDGWTVRVQRSLFVLALDKNSFVTLEGQTKWENTELSVLEADGITIEARVIQDPFDAFNKAVHFTFIDNGTEAVPDITEFGIDTNTYQITRSDIWYRIRLEHTKEWDIGFTPKELLGYHRYFMLGPQDDFNKINTTYTNPVTAELVRDNLKTIYNQYEELNVNRTFEGEKVYEEKDVIYSTDLNNAAYWAEDGDGYTCPQPALTTQNDVIELKCERIEKKIANLPYKHSEWSFDFAKRPLVDTADLSTKPTDRFQVFNQEGDITFGLNFEFKQINTSSKARFDIFFDDFFLTTGNAFSGLLGADNQGQDVLSILIWGSRASLIVGILATFFSLSLGIVVGLASGYAGGLFDDVIMRFVDFLLIMPGLPLLLALAAILKPSIWNLIIVIAALGWPGTARLIRSQVLVEKEKAYVESAKAAGASDTYILFKHILPNVLPLVFAIAATGISGAILSLAALDYLGLGDQFQVSWGLMLQSATQTGAATAGYWWLVVTPGFCIAALSLAFALMGYTTQQIVNPRLRARAD